MTAPRHAPASPASVKWTDLDRLRKASPMYDAVIDEVQGPPDPHRRPLAGRLRVLQLPRLRPRPEIIDSIDPAVRQWGTHPSWSRLLGNPRLYCDIEDQLTDLLGAPDTLVLPTITHIHTSVIPILAGKGWIFVDRHAHKTIYDGAGIAVGRGATIRRFRPNDLDDLERHAQQAPAGRAQAGVHGRRQQHDRQRARPAQPSPRCARRHDALLYVDDAHGFGVIGETTAADTTPLRAARQQHRPPLGESYDNIVLVGGFSKAYSSLLAFLALPTWLKNHLKVAAAAVSVLRAVADRVAGHRARRLRGQRQPRRRRSASDLYRKTAGSSTTSTPSACAPRTVRASDHRDAAAPRRATSTRSGEFLFDRGIYVTLAAYPLVPRKEVGFRIQITAANGDDEIEELCAVLRELAGRFDLRRVHD